MNTYRVTGSFGQDGALRTVTVYRQPNEDQAKEVAEKYWQHKRCGMPDMIRAQRIERQL